MIKNALDGHATFIGRNGHNKLRDHLRGTRSSITMVAKFDNTVPGGAGYDENTRAIPSAAAAPARTTIDMQATKPGPLGTHDRHILKFDHSDNCLKVGHDYAETGVNRANTDERKILMKAFNKPGVNLDGVLPRGTYDFLIITQSYSQGTKKKSSIRVVY